MKKANIAMFASLIALVIIYLAYINVRSNMLAREVEIYKQQGIEKAEETDQQLGLISKALSREQEENDFLKARQDTLQHKITKLAQIKDSLAITLYKEKKALNNANRQRRRLEQQIKDSINDDPALSPLEQRYRSGYPSRGQQPQH